MISYVSISMIYIILSFIIGHDFRYKYMLIPKIKDNSLQFKGKFSCMVKQSVRYVHRCLEFAILRKMSTNNPSQKSVVLEFSVKPSLGCQGLVWQKIQEPLTQDNCATQVNQNFVLLQGRIRSHECFLDRNSKYMKYCFFKKNMKEN